MKTSAPIIFAFLVLASSAVAQVPGGQVQVSGKSVTLTGIDDATGNVSIAVPNATPVFKLFTGGSQRIQIDGKGNTALAPVVPTMASTPVAGTNDFKGVVNVVPTAALNTAALLPASPTAGDLKIIVNNGPNAVRVKAGGTDTINGGSAGNYIPLATMQQAECVAMSTSAWNCSLQTVPTPAGP